MENKKYNVYINETLKLQTDSEKEAWEYIGNQPFGFRHFVTDEKGECRQEFTPF